MKSLLKDLIAIQVYIAISNPFISNEVRSEILKIGCRHHKTFEPLLRSFQEESEEPEQKPSDEQESAQAEIRFLEQIRQPS